jgi:hypothetical protein
VSNALSKYIDELSGNKISSYLRNHIPMNIENLGPYPDFLAFGLVLCVTGIFSI